MLPWSSPSPLPENPFAQTIWQQHNHSDCQLRNIFYTYQHSCSCNVVPFLALWDLAGTSASSSLCENSSALHFLTPREMAGPPLHSHSAAPAWYLAPTCTYTRLPDSAQQCSELEGAGSLEWGCRGQSHHGWKAVAQLTMAHKHYPHCSAGFKLQPFSHSCCPHSSSFLRMWQGGPICHGMVFPSSLQW